MKCFNTIVRNSAIIAFFVYSFALQAADYHIDSHSGDDANDGLSPANAWKSFKNINSKTFEAGDRILLKRGISWLGSISPKGSGQEQLPITLSAYGDGDRPIIDGNGQVRAVVYLRNQSNWIIENLEIKNYVSERGDTYRNGK